MFSHPQLQLALELTRQDHSASQSRVTIRKYILVPGSPAALEVTPRDHSYATRSPYSYIGSLKRTFRLWWFYICLGDIHIQWRTQKFFMGGGSFSGVWCHLYLVWIVSDVIFMLSKSTFWRSNMSWNLHANSFRVICIKSTN